MLLNPRLEDNMMPVVIHPFLKNGVEARAYQIRALKNALSSSCLMVMPTGFGKTAVEWMVMAEFLRLQQKKIILIAPTTGLVAQQQRMAREMMNIDPDMILRYTGETPPEKRTEIWQKGRILMATPQVIRNDATNRRISLDEVSLIIFDEAHHATGNHAYAQVGDLYLNHNNGGFTLAATASPGSSKGAILEVAKRLGIDRLDVSVKDEALLRPYTVKLHNDIIYVDLPESLKTLIFPLQEHQSREVENIQRMGFMGSVKNLTSRIITEAQQSVSRAISRRDKRGYNAARKVSDIRRMHMLLDLLKTQGVYAGLAFLDKAESEGRTGDRGTNRFLSQPVIHNFRINAKNLGELHPKANIVREMVRDRISENPNSRILIFTEYRYTVKNLTELLSTIEGVKVSQFIGQSSSGKQKGMTQKEQLARLEEFRSGEINVLVATSVGEEGLDVPAAELVLMYEPVPSAIRSIQRRGRTARQSSGTVKTLVANDTRDQYVSHAAKARERKMYNNLADIERQGRIEFRPSSKVDTLVAFDIEIDGERITADEFLELETTRLNKLYPVEQTNDNVQKDKNNNHKKPPKKVSLKDKRPRNQMGLDQFFDKETGTKGQREREIDSINAANEVVKQMNEEIKSIVKLDYREASSTLSAYVSSLGMTVEYDNLTTGDILIDQDILIERKTSRDLLTSIIDGRLFKQCQRMKNGKIKPLLLIELGEIGNSVHPNAVLGALAHITLDLGVPIITTKNSMESAHLIYLIAKQSGGISDSIREFIAYAEIDETEIDKICQIAADEISAMVNEGKDTNLLLTRWKNDGITKQIKLLSSMTKIDTKTCTKLIEKYQSIAGLFRTSLVDISNELPEEELQKLAHFY
jgi:Fanconi anemia group M protein